MPCVNSKDPTTSKQGVSLSSSTAQRSSHRATVDQTYDGLGPEWSRHFLCAGKNSDFSFESSFLEERDISASKLVCAFLTPVESFHLIVGPHITFSIGLASEEMLQAPTNHATIAMWEHLQEALIVGTPDSHSCSCGIGSGSFTKIHNPAWHGQ